MAEKIPVIIDNCEDEPANRMITIHDGWPIK